MSSCPRLSASLLAADFAHLGAEVQAITDAGADMIHLDVMDGVFVPNLTFGAGVIAALRPLTPLPFDAHLMVAHPDRLFPDFVKAGCQAITFHPEAVRDPAATLRQIRELGARAGLALNPDVPIETISPYLNDMDIVLIMTVQAGAGGQTFRPLYDKISAARDLIRKSGHAIDLSVDGGLGPQNAGNVIAAGATTLVAGTAIFKGGPDHYAANIQALRSAKAC